MARSDIKWQMRLYGMSELNASLAQLPRAHRRKLQRRGMRNAAKVFAKEAKLQCPVDTGKLKKSIKVRALKRSRTQFGFSVRTGTRAELDITEKAKGYYPAAIEYGWTRGGKSHLPNPFMRRAFTTKQAEMRQEMTDSIWRDLREAVAEVRR